jgi:hypothetical protein
MLYPLISSSVRLLLSSPYVAVRWPVYKGYGESAISAALSKAVRPAAATHAGISVPATVSLDDGSVEYDGVQKPPI